MNTAQNSASPELVKPPNGRALTQHCTDPIARDDPPAGIMNYYRDETLGTRLARLLGNLRNPAETAAILDRLALAEETRTFQPRNPDSFPTSGQLRQATLFEETLETNRAGTLPLRRPAQSDTCYGRQ